MRQLMTGFIKLSNLKAHSYKIITMNTRIKFYLKAALVISFNRYCFYLEVLRGETAAQKSSLQTENGHQIHECISPPSVTSIELISLCTWKTICHRLPTSFFNHCYRSCDNNPKLLFKLISCPLCIRSVNNFAILRRCWNVGNYLSRSLITTAKATINQEFYLHFYRTQTSICTMP